MPDLAEARELVRTGDYDTLELLYDDIPDTLSQLIRTAFIPRPGYKFVVSDYSAIEARVLSYLAGEKWRSRVFAEGKDIYCASASQMFGVPVEKHGVNSHLRQKGKIAELALGYGGSVGALKSMGALEMGLTEDELQPLVDAWRSANLNIVQYWWDVDAAVKTTVKQRITTKVGSIRFQYKSGMLFIHLPSGRTLSYVKPKMGENRFGGESVTYEGVGSNKKWQRIESYGPKFVENIVQAISRDLLCFAMQNLSFCFICGHVHAHALCLDTTYNPFEDIRNEETLSKKLKYLFKKEGKNFFAYLVQSVTGNIIVPYTTDALAGIPFNSLKSFWESTYNAYGYYHCQSSSRSDKLEDFLFLINAENIFHLTYTEKVFQKYNKIFYTLKENAVYGFETSLMLIRELQDCPLQTLSCALLDVNFDKYFERQSFPDVAQPEIYRDIYVSIMEKMTNYFYSLLLKSYGCIMSITENQDFTHTVIEENGREYTIRDVDIPESPRDVLENMEKLKQIILDYLMVNPDVNLSWSILRNKDKPDFEKIISDDFFNFCVSFALFAPPYEFNDLATMNRSEFDISKYLKYAMKQKDF